MLKKNNVNKHSSARLTGGKLTEEPKLKENYEDEFVMNVIAQLATVNSQIGLFSTNQRLPPKKTTNMHDKRLLIDTRRHQTIIPYNHLHCNKQPPQTVNFNKTRYDTNNQRNADSPFRENGKPNFHWAADDQIMEVVKRRHKSLETEELIRRRTDLAKPRILRPYWNRKVEKEVYVPSKPKEEGRKEIKRTDIKLETKLKDTHLDGGYFAEFDIIPPKQPKEIESTTSSSTEEPTTHEPGSYPAIPVQDCRDGPMIDLNSHF